MAMFRVHFYFKTGLLILLRLFPRKYLKVEGTLKRHPEISDGHPKRFYRTLQKVLSNP